jgi:hypothetical protein
MVDGCEALALAHGPDRNERQFSQEIGHCHPSAAWESTRHRVVILVPKHQAHRVLAAPVLIAKPSFESHRDAAHRSRGILDSSDGPSGDRDILQIFPQPTGSVADGTLRVVNGCFRQLAEVCVSNTGASAPPENGCLPVEVVQMPSIIISTSGTAEI